MAHSDDTAVTSERTLPILDVGCCEPLKAAVHGAAMGLTVLMGVYNAAAWLRRRERHLAINAIIYLAAGVWEERHVRHHFGRCLRTPGPEGVASAPRPHIRKAA